MQLITVAIAFATAALAAPQGFRPPPIFTPPPGQGDQNGFYKASCGCAQNGRLNPQLTSLACRQLNSEYPNLIPDSIDYFQHFGCTDQVFIQSAWRGDSLFGRPNGGIESNGMLARCINQAQMFGIPAFGLDVQCSQF